MPQNTKYKSVEVKQLEGKDNGEDIIGKEGQ